MLYFITLPLGFWKASDIIYYGKEPTIFFNDIGYIKTMISCNIDFKLK